jgi:hypothetical protein
MRSYKVLAVATAVNVLLVGAAWFGFVGVQPSGAQSSDGGRLQAPGFDLVNDDGVVVAQLYVGEDGTGQLRLRDANGEVRVKLGAGPTGSGLILFNAEREPEPGVSASTDEDGTKITLVHGEMKKTVKP